MKLCKNQNELTTRYILPVRVVTAENAENPEMLLDEHPRQAFLGDVPFCMIKKGGYAVFDFGEEIQGGADIVVQHLEDNVSPDVRFRLVFGESVTEAMSTVGEKNALNDHSPRDFVVTTTFLSHHTTGNTGFRFLKIEAVDASFRISSLQGVAKFRDIEYKGSFECSDERLNEIWRVGAKTVHLNMQEYLWDGIKRDRLVWIGDMHPEVSTILSVFGECDVVKKSLDLMKDNTVEWANETPSYSMWMLKIYLDLYRYTGNIAYLSENAEFIKKTLNSVIDVIDNDLEVYRFTEWSNFKTGDEDAGFYAMLIIGLEAGAEILNILKRNPALSANCRATASELKKMIFPNVKNKQVAAMLALSGLADTSDICESVIKPNGASGLSTFWGYYVLNTLAKNGDMSFALELIRTYWGGMLDLGATTFWEEFDIDEAKNAARIDEICPPGKDDIHADFGKHCYPGLRRSLCHGWASGPTAFLSREVLGIVPAEPGFKKIKIAPVLGDLSFAKGGVPSPYGVIEVAHTRDGEKIKTEISLPDGIEIVKEN